MPTTKAAPGVRLIQLIGFEKNSVLMGLDDQGRIWRIFYVNTTTVTLTKMELLLDAEMKPTP